MEKEKLNNVVVEYRNTRSEELFGIIYEEVIGKVRPKLETIGKSILADSHEILAIYEDTLLKCIETYDGSSDFEMYFKFNVKNRRTDFYRHVQYISRNEVYETANDEDDTAMFEIVDPFKLEDYALRTKKADQRQLIDFLVNGEDETTTAIVETFLEHPKPSATAIAKELGFHHSKVIRALTRLAAKFDSKKFGNYRDFLVAQ